LEKINSLIGFCEELNCEVRKNQILRDYTTFKIGGECPAVILPSDTGMLCEIIKKHIPSFNYLEASVGTDPDKRNYLVSNAKIEALGYKALYSLDDGIEELIKVYGIIKNSSYGNV